MDGQDAMRGASAALVSDCLDRLGLAGQVMAGAVAPLDPSMRAVGPAHTLEASDVPGAVDDPYAGEVAAVDAIPAGAVVVVSTFSGAAIWGELLATAATARGAAGVVSDGPVRDSQPLREMGFATFCRGVNPLDAQGRVSIVRHGREVACAGVRVGSGDLIVADADGVVAVPRAHLADVARLVAEKTRGESAVRAALVAGASLRSVFDEHRIL